MTLPSNPEGCFDPGTCGSGWLAASVLGFLAVSVPFASAPKTTLPFREPGRARVSAACWFGGFTVETYFWNGHPGKETGAPWCHSTGMLKWDLLGNRPGAGLKDKISQVSSSDASSPMPHEHMEVCKTLLKSKSTNCLAHWPQKKLLFFCHLT